MEHKLSRKLMFFVLFVAVMVIIIGAFSLYHYSDESKLMVEGVLVNNGLQL